MVSHISHDWFMILMMLLLSFKNTACFSSARIRIGHPVNHLFKSQRPAFVTNIPNGPYISQQSDPNRLVMSSNIFKQLEGNWIFSRQLNSRLPSCPSGVVTGNVQFSRQSREADGTMISSDHGDYDLVYHEKGLFQASVGKFEVSNSYIYAMNDRDETIEIFFKPESNLPGRGKPFITLNLKGDGRTWHACADHLCIVDKYNATYTFSLGANEELKDVEIVFEVQGPNKDYDSVTLLTRG